MNLRAMLGLGSLLLIATGSCVRPEWGKGGINDRAMAKDTRKALEDDEAPCPEGMTCRRTARSVDLTDDPERICQ